MSEIHRFVHHTSRDKHENGVGGFTVLGRTTTNISKTKISEDELLSQKILSDNFQLFRSVHVKVSTRTLYTLSYNFTLK